MGKLKQFRIEDIIKTSRLMHEYHSEYHWEDGWNKHEKIRNFTDLMRLPELTGVPISGTSCLDVGCGTGDLSLFLRKRGAIRYLGVDIYEPSLKKARKKYPHEEFRFMDLIAEPLEEQFDYAFCSGGLSVNLSVNNYEFLSAMVNVMWNQTRVGVAFNVLTDTDEEPDPNLFFYNVQKVLRICKRIAKNGSVVTEARDDLDQSQFYLYRG